jgi:23S rRNA (cytidine1920-2'-O)/16S rRNA (cytidine1409-2'-O)-methyltransferase
MKKRLDVLLYERKLFPTREKAKRAIMAGKVRVEGEVQTKPGTFVPVNSEVEVKKKPAYVSRGGYKLEWALKKFEVEISRKVCLDVGAGTGGFTHCLLRKGAKLVIAVDVGYGQLDYGLRNDPRVFLIERENIRYLSPEKIPERPEIVLVDLSFISTTKVFANLQRLARKDASFIILIKPQFEAGKESVGKGGIVREKSVHVDVLRKLWSFFRKSGYKVRLTYSPILGREGNIEFFALLTPGEERDEPNFQRVVDEAHEKARPEP